MSFSIVIQLEAKRAAQPRRPTLRIGRGAGSGSDDAQSRRSRSFEGSWLVYTPQRSDGTGCWSLCCHGRRRLMSSAVADVVADRRHRHRRAHRRRRARRRRRRRRARRRRRRTSAACCSCCRPPLLRADGSGTSGRCRSRKRPSLSPGAQPPRRHRRHNQQVDR